MKMFQGMLKNQKLYFSLLLSLIVCAVVTLLISSAILYFNFEKMALEQVYSDNMLNLKQASRAVSLTAETALKLANQIYKDFNVSKLQYYDSPNIYDVRGAFAQLDSYRMAVSFIESIYVYNKKNQTIYVDSGIYNSINTTSRESIQSSSRFDDPEILRFIRDYKKYPPYIPNPRKLVLHQSGITTVNYYYTFFLYDVFSDGPLNSAVVVNIHEDWIGKVVNGDTEDMGLTFIIDGKGKLVSHAGRLKMLFDLSREEYIAAILQNPESSGYFTGVVNGVKSLVSYTEPDSFGWRYIRVTPVHVIFSKIESARNKTVLIGLALLLAGISGAYLLSRRLYAPIKQIMTDLEDMETAKMRSDAAVKQEYLRTVVTGQDGNPSEIKTRFEELNIRLNPKGLFGLILLKIDNYRSFKLQHHSENISLLKEVLIRGAEEYGAGRFHFETVDMGNGCLLFILNESDTDTDSDAEVMTEIARGIRRFASDRLNISVSLTVSSIGESAASLNGLYNQVAEASLHRLFYGHGSIISAESVMALKSKEYAFPTHKEKNLVEALMTGNLPEVKRIYREIVVETAEHSFAAFNLAMSRLIITLNNTLNVIQTNNHLPESFNLKPLSLLNEMETMDEIDRHFFGVFEAVKDNLEKKKSMKHENLVRRIQEMIQDQYSDPALSVDSVADALGLTISYTCRIYKQYTLNTILESIIEVRMNKAKELLAATRLSVADIAAKVGFTNSSYFYKAFKKANGVTPNEYRRAVGADEVPESVSL